MTQEHNTALQDPIFFTKQPILDTKRSIWGYELLGGEQKEGIYEIFPQQESVASLFSSAYVGLQEAMQRGKKIMVGFDDASIITGVPYALPPSYGVVRVLPGEPRPPGSMPPCRNCAGKATRPSWKSSPAMPLAAEAFAGADIFAFDLSLGKPDGALLNQMQTRNAIMMARGVKGLEQFQAARDLGFNLFQGPFFKEPEYVRDRKLASNVVSRLNLLRLMEGDDPDVKALGAAIRTDVSISFRLLAYLNSPGSGFGRISSPSTRPSGCSAG